MKTKNTPPVDKQDFENKLLESIKQMQTHRNGQTVAVRTTQVQISQVVEARHKVGVSQRLFAQLLGVSTRTLQEWEQGRRAPSGAAQSLLRIAIKHPEVLKELQA